MKTIYQEICEAKQNGKKLLAILLDPEKLEVNQVEKLCLKVNGTLATHLFIGGSTFNGTHLDALILELKKYLKLPVLLFPGDYNQLSAHADGLLFLSLFSGRNPDYLISHQIKAVSLLEKMNLEIIPTAYLLIDGGNETAVETVSQTKPLDRNNSTEIWQTAKAASYIGSKLIYLEAGSGAILSVPEEVISTVANKVAVPLIVGGGIRSLNQMENAYMAGATLVVIGTAFENDNTFFEL